MTVLGRVRGNVVASGHLEIGPKGKVLGDITVESFRVHTGGVFRGTSCMGAEESTTPCSRSSAPLREAPRGRTLPPPNGAVPPPPMLEEVGGSSPGLVPDDARQPAAAHLVDDRHRHGVVGARDGELMP